LGDSSSILSKVITVFYYPVNALRVYSDGIYDSTEYLYEMAGGERSILTRAADFGFHRIKQPKNFKVADSYWHNGNKYLIINYYSNGKVRSVIRNGKKAKDCSAVFYYSSGQKIRVVRHNEIQAYWSNGTMFARCTDEDGDGKFTGTDTYIEAKENENLKKLQEEIKNSDPEKIDWEAISMLQQTRQWTLAVTEIKDGEVIKKITDLSSLGGTPELIEEYIQWLIAF
jgi:hypothetical protein